MVALAVFALAVLALVRLEGATLRGAASVDDTLAASMLARTLAAEALTDPRAPVLGTASGSEVNGGRPWRWTRTVQPTGDSRILGIDVTVTDVRGVQRGRATLVRSTIGEATR
jgi:general secretion pathway protein I